jgi:hypothetical protein
MESGLMGVTSVRIEMLQIIQAITL